ncbi:MAG: Sulfate adenylyltransferase / Adenylylsulfate kinase, partial [uncultured Nocardioides sp.]
QVRSMVAEAGGAFFLIHVATPVEECERRDRKGLYAKARRGEIPEFTGISSPYEEPDDADVRVDTTGRTIEDALDDVVESLAERGHLDLRRPTITSELSPVVDQAPQTADEPLRVLFVCTANICRSAYLEIAARALAGDRRITFTSAGTHGFDASAMDGVMATTLTSADPDFRSRPLTRDIVEEADLILTAESSHRAFVLEEHPQALRKVFTVGQFARTVEELPDLRGRELIVAARQRRLAPHPDDDIADPYRRGDAASEAAAGRMSTMLSVIVPALAEET